MLLRLAELFIAESRPEEAIRQLLAKKSGAEEEEDPSSTKCYYSAESSTSLQQVIRYFTFYIVDN
jgi:hypothetical protein